MLEAAASTTVAEISPGIYRIHTPVPPEAFPGGFSFNQYLVDDDEPLLFHTGPKKLFPQVRDAVARVLPLARLRWVAFSHVESDECGSLNRWLEAAPKSQPLCGAIAAMVSIEDLADRAPRALADGEELRLGRHVVRWLDAPHLPHGWECGYFFEPTTKTLLCGDLFTQPGAGEAPVTEEDVLESSEAMRAKLEYFSHSRRTGELIAKLAATRPTRLACMHGSAWRGDGAALLGRLGERLRG